MNEKTYQNIDLPQDNPLEVEEKNTDIPVKKPLSPKILFLIILGVIIFILLLLSLIVVQVRKNKSNQSTIIPSPAPVVAQPTTTDSLIPSIYQQKFKEIEQSFSEDPNLPVPQIDTTIGL
jgi:hypothetical protein